MSRKPRRWIERMVLRCADREAQIIGADFSFDVYCRFVLGGLTPLEIREVLEHTRGIYVRDVALAAAIFNEAPVN